jgi:hypothetical protein
MVLLLYPWLCQYTVSHNMVGEKLAGHDLRTDLCFCGISDSCCRLALRCLRMQLILTRVRGERGYVK